MTEYSTTPPSINRIRIGDAEIELIPVVSSNVLAIGYTANTLIVHFTGNAYYRIDGVSPELWKQFQQAPSKGSFYHKHFKGLSPTRLDLTNIEVFVCQTDDTKGKDNGHTTPVDTAQEDQDARD